MAITGFAPSAVEILDGYATADDEALIVDIDGRGRDGVCVELVLSGGQAAGVRMRADDAEALELRLGAIVPVSRAA
jgi:hypothetical protein